MESCEACYLVCWEFFSEMLEVICCLSFLENNWGRNLNANLNGGLWVTTLSDQLLRQMCLRSYIWYNRRGTWSAKLVCVVLFVTCLYRLLSVLKRNSFWEVLYHHIVLLLVYFCLEWGDEWERIDNVVS